MLASVDSTHAACNVDSETGTAIGVGLSGGRDGEAGRAVGEQAAAPIKNSAKILKAFFILVSNSPNYLIRTKFLETAFNSF